MGEYLIFFKLGGGLMAAIAAAILIWRKKGIDTIEKPKETVEGDFVIHKPADEYMEGVQYDSISNNINIKQNGDNNDLGDSSSDGITSVDVAG